MSPTFLHRSRFTLRIQSKSGRHLLLAQWLRSSSISSILKERSAAFQHVADKRNRSWGKLRMKYKHWCLTTLRARLRRHSYKVNSSQSRASAGSAISLSQLHECQIMKGKEAAVEADLSQEVGCLGQAVSVAPKAEPKSGSMTERGSLSLKNHNISGLLPIRGWLLKVEAAIFGWSRIPLWRSSKKSFQKTYSQACLFSKLRWWACREWDCSWLLFRI